MEAKRKLPVWAWILIGVATFAVVVGGTLFVSSLIRNHNSNKTAVVSTTTYQTVTVMVETPKRILRRFAGYDGEVGDGYQLLRIDDQKDNPGFAEFDCVATGSDVVLNAVVDMGQGTRRGWLSDPKNVSLATIVVKETGKRLTLSESDIVLRKTGDSKVATRIFKFMVTPEGEPVQSLPTPSSAAPTQTSENTQTGMGSAPAKK